MQSIILIDSVLKVMKGPPVNIPAVCLYRCEERASSAECSPHSCSLNGLKGT